VETSSEDTSQKRMRVSLLSSEAVMLTCGVVVGANKNRIVAIVDIPNEFIQTAAEDEKDREFILIHGPFADILVSTAPDVY
jgi:hypothetical protein